jgi:hypothetical protein
MNIFRMMSKSPYGENEHDDDVWKGGTVNKFIVGCNIHKNMSIDVGMSSNISRRL